MGKNNCMPGRAAIGLKRLITAHRHRQANLIGIRVENCDMLATAT